ncbi:MAG: pyruvate ferredoxin oxidoreductase [Deferribacterota bacterium]|nr:pyruvate ferredoxin oxidoreductase [Deferribacterota bacterium]
MKTEHIEEKQYREMLLGSDAVSTAVKYCDPDVIAAYPITPQTHIIETLSEMVNKGEIKGQYIKVESEMTAIAACYGASAAGSRAFTATSSHGLAFMHEMLHWYSGSRFPLVLVNANRALGAPWSIWTDQSDSMAQRDTGFIQIYCETVQECFDFVIQGYYISESLMVPVMVMIDGFILSHVMEPLYIPTKNLVDKFLPKYKPPYKLDVNNPLSFNAASKGDSFYNLKKMQDKAIKDACGLFKTCNNEFYKIFERKYSAIEEYRMRDAEIVFITCGAISGTVKVVVDELREDGLKIGLLRVILFRPFPRHELVKKVDNISKLIILSRSISYGANATLAQEIRSALYNVTKRPAIYDVVISLGGKEVFPGEIKNIIKNLHDLSEEETNWLKV